MKRIALVIVLALAVFGGILFMAPGFMDWSKHKEQVVTQLHNVTGLDYKIDGDIELAILPYPRLKVGGLSVANPALAKDPLLTLKEAQVAVALVPLFSGRINVTRVVLVQPDVRLAMAADGTPSWMTPQIRAMTAAGGTAETKPEGMGAAIALNEIGVRDGTLSFNDRRSGKEYQIGGATMTLRADTLAGPYSARGDLVYGGQKMSLDAKTGKKGPDGEYPVQIEAVIPSANTKMTFSGVVSLKDGWEVQGETGIQTAVLKSLIALAKTGENENENEEKATPAWLSKPFSAQGLLTASPVALAYKNAKFTLDTMTAAGGVTVAMPKGGRQIVEAALEFSTPVDADLFMPPPAGKAAGFLPVSVILPADIQVKADLSAPAAKIKGKSFSDVKMKIFRDAQKMKADVTASLPGEGSVTLVGDLAFGSSSVAAKTGAITLADPSLAYTLRLKAADSAKALTPLLPPAAMTAAKPYLKGAVTAALDGRITPKLAAVEKGSVALKGTTFAVGGSFAPQKNNGRDLLTVALSADKIDADAWLPKADPAAPKGQDGLRKAVGKLALPFDLDLSASFKNLRYRGADYQSFALLGTLKNKSLSLKTLELNDPAGNSIALSGTAADIAALKNLDMTASVATPDLKAFLTALGVKADKVPAGIKTADIVTEFKGQPENLAFTANVKAGGGTLDASGTVADVLDIPALSGLTVRVIHPNYVELARLFAPDFKSGTALRKNLDVFASMKREGQVYGFSQLKATVGDATFTGDMKADMSGAKPFISASLQAGDVPLDQILGHNARPKGVVRASNTGGGGEGRWSRNPVNVGWMNAFNADIDATAKSFSYGPWNFSNATADITLKDGVLNIAKIEGGMGGGRASVTGKAVAPAQAGQAVTVDGKAALENVNIESFVSNFSGSRLVRGKGAINLDSSIKASGASPAALIMSLSGGGKADGANLLFEGFDLARLSRVLAQPSSSGTENLTGLLDATMGGGTTSFDKMTLNFSISQGVINVTELALTGKDAVVNMPGMVNLPLWTIDMEATVRLTEPADAPPLKVAFKGPLDNPGQAFGKSAMESYFNKMIGDRVQNLLLDKLQDKGILPKAPVAPAPNPVEPAPAESLPAPVTEVAPSEPQPQEIRPEDVFMGVLQGVLEGQ